MPTRQQQHTGKGKDESARKSKAQGGDGQKSARKSKAQGGDGQETARKSKAQGGDGQEDERKGKAQSRKVKVNLNTASEQELRAIEGMSAQRARQLVRYREEHGELEDFSDLENVEGFDSQIIGTLKRQATI